MPGFKTEKKQFIFCVLVQPTSSLTPRFARITLLLLHIQYHKPASLCFLHHSHRQERAYVPEPAFPFQALQASGQLVLASSLAAAVAQRPGCLDRPCIGGWCALYVCVC
jgi:hypothetical protein